MNTPTLPDTSIQARQATGEEIAKYNSDGYVLFRELVSSEHAALLREEVMKIVEVIGLGHTKLRQTAQYLKDSLLAEYVQSSTLKSLAAALFGARAYLYLPFTAVKSGGGGGRFHFHQDGNYTKYVRGAGVNFWMALDPMRGENGGLRIVPGSHLKGELAAESAGDGDAHRKVSFEPANSQLLEMEPGDCVAFNRWTVHGSGPNQTESHRVAYAVQFHSEDAARMVDDVERRLLDHPRFTDIWGVDEIVAANAGSRDGH